MKKTKISRQRPQSAEEDISDEDADPETFDMNPTAIIVFVILMCVMLISLYFFYDYLGKYSFMFCIYTISYLKLNELGIYCSVMYFIQN